MDLFKEDMKGFYKPKLKLTRSWCNDCWWLLYNTNCCQIESQKTLCTQTRTPTMLCGLEVLQYPSSVCVLQLDYCWIYFSRHVDVFSPVLKFSLSASLWSVCRLFSTMKINLNKHCDSNTRVTSVTVDYELLFVCLLDIQKYFFIEEGFLFNVNI